MEMNSAVTARAVFAGGCFWCMDPPFAKLAGVHSVVSGYIGGHSENPSYREVCTGTTGHAEAIEVSYDLGKISYEQLLKVFWMNIDPTDESGQFVDRGSQYRTGIFYLDAEQQRLAEASRERLAASGRFSRPIATEIVPATRFYPAEDYHQGYCKANPVDYNLYRYNSGRGRFLRKVWGKDEK